MAALRKNMEGKAERAAQSSKTLERTLEAFSSSEEEDSLHDKVQAEHMKEIEKKKEREENLASSQPKC